MKNICLYFQVHQPFRLRNYSFFDIGKDSYYYNDFLNESIVSRVAEKCYLPTNEILLKLIKKHKGNFKVAFSITGSVLDQFKLYTPEVIKSFNKLAKTGCVEFLSETYSHSLSSQGQWDIFQQQVKKHDELIEKLFEQKPKVFRNTELIYSDEIGKRVYKMGYKGMITEGAKHILGWKSPNYLYYNNEQPKLKLLLKNYKLSDDIAFRFSDKMWDEYPLTAEKFADKINKINPKDEIVNIFMDYETFGEHQWKETGIFEFLENLPSTIFKNTNFSFKLPTEVIKEHQPIAPANVPYPISWADEERDISAWLGNDLQKEAFEKLYSLSKKIKQITDTKLLQDWEYLQASDHFYYMSTKWFSDGEVHAYFNPYQSPYDAFINYMNVLSDFSHRVNKLIPDPQETKKINKLNTKIAKQKQEIKELKQKVAKMSNV